MAKFNIDLKKFKHVSSDDKSTTLRHKDGHEMKISHKSLSPDFQKQLEALSKSNPKKMADGGVTPANEDAEIHSGDASIPSSPSSSSKSSSGGEGIAKLLPLLAASKGGRVNYDEGGGVLDSIRRSGWAGSAAQETQKIDDTRANPRTTTIPSSKSAGPTQGRPGYEEGGVVDKIKEFMSPIFHGAEKTEESIQNQDPRSRPIFNSTPEDPNPGKKAHHQKYAEGGDVAPGPCLNPNCKSHGKPHPNCRCYMADGGEVKPVCSMKGHHYNHCEHYVTKMADGGEAPPDPKESAEHKYEMIVDQPYEEDPAKDIAKEVEDSENFVKGAAPQQPMEQEAAPQPDAQQPQAQPMAQQQPQDPSQFRSTPQEDPMNSSNPLIRQAAYQQEHQENLKKDLLNHDAEWDQDLRNGHITPKTYQDLFAKNADGSDRGTLSKIGTIFGLMLGGAGAGLTHGPNQALEMMNNVIKNDLAAQEKSKENAKNYMSLAQNYVLNEANAKHLDAETAAKKYALGNMFANRAALAEMHRIVETMPKGSPEYIKAQQQLAYLGDAVQTENYGIAERASALGARAHMLGIGPDSGNAPATEAAFQQRNKALTSGMFGETAKSMGEYEAAHHIPGMPGKTTKIVNQGDIDKLVAYNTLDSQLKNLQDSVKQYKALSIKGNLDPKVLGAMAVKAHETAALYNKTLDGLGMTEGRMDWLGKQIPDSPQTFFEQLKGSNEKLAEVAKNNGMRKDKFLTGLGYTENNKRQPDTIERFEPKSGKTAIFDKKSKKFLNWK